MIAFVGSTSESKPILLTTFIIFSCYLLKWYNRVFLPNPSKRGNKDLPVEYDEQLVRRLIEKVTVFDDKLTVEFKSGVEIDV